ncbi:hypothetical protein ACLOJK_014739 [Asimina triloba]
MGADLAVDLGMGNDVADRLNCVIDFAEFCYWMWQTNGVIGIREDDAVSDYSFFFARQFAMVGSSVLWLLSMEERCYHGQKRGRRWSKIQFHALICLIRQNLLLIEMLVIPMLLTIAGHGDDGFFMADQMMLPPTVEKKKMLPPLSLIPAARLGFSAGANWEDDGGEVPVLYHGATMMDL